MGHNTHTQQKVGWGGYLAFFYYDYSFFQHVCEKYRMVASL